MVVLLVGLVVNFVVIFVLELLFLSQTECLKRISIRYSGDAYSFQCGIQLFMWDELRSFCWLV